MRLLVFIGIFGPLMIVLSFVFAPPLVCLLFGSPMIYYLRPRYFPCKGWKRITVLYIVLCLILSHVFVFSNWLNKEEISSLIKSEGILECSIDAEDTKKYFVVSENPKYRQCVKFFLCDIRQEKYLSENITVWHNVECYVYQMQVGDKMIVSIEDANKNVWYGNWCHFFWMLPILILGTLHCLLALSYLNNHYRKETLK